MVVRLVWHKGIATCVNYPIDRTMDLLLHDLLDLPVPASEFVADGRLRIDTLLDSPGMRASLAFHAAWTIAVGMSATRADFASFVGRIPGGTTAAATWSAGTSNALIAEICCTFVRMLQENVIKQIIERAANVYERTLADLSERTLADAPTDYPLGEGDRGMTKGRQRTLSALLAKLADRFGATQAMVSRVTDPAGLPAAYASMVVTDPSLARLERWAHGGDRCMGAVALVADYYTRARAAASILRLPARSPISGFDVAGAPSVDTMPLSPLELLRYPVSRDMYLWRHDVGGALLVCGPATRAIVDGANPDPFKFRTVSGPCAALMLPALPPAYVRVVIDVADGDDARSAEEAREHGRIADIVTLAPAVDVDLDTASSRRSKLDRRLIVSRNWSRDAETPAASYWLPTHDALFGAPEKPPRWAAAVASSALSAHLLHPCPLAPQSKPGNHGVLMMQSYVMRYASARRLGERVFVTAPPGKAGRIGEVVLIDNRCNVWSVLSVLVTLDNLRAADWSVRILCGSANRDWMAQTLLPHVPHACIEVVPQLSRSCEIEDYNVLLKSPDLWRRLSASPRVLTVQDDGMLALPGLDGPDFDDVRAQPFVGAPWRQMPDAYRMMMETAGVPPALVGNGGLSLRDPAVMLEICEAEVNGLSHALFNSNTQPMPEDVFFAVALGRRSIPRATREQAARFAFEMDLPGAHAPLPLGFHKPWPYSDPADVSAVFERLLKTRLA